MKTSLNPFYGFYVVIFYRADILKMYVWCNFALFPLFTQTMCYGVRHAGTGVRGGGGGECVLL